MMQSGHSYMSLFRERRMYDFNEEAFQNHNKLHCFYIEKFHCAACRNCQMIVLCTQTLELIILFHLCQLYSTHTAIISVDILCPCPAIGYRMNRMAGELEPDLTYSAVSPNMR